jgi:nitrogen fixation/metabolism regulation signal transduction histidine kinase
VDAIVDVYNAMISRLREERLSVREKNQFLDLLMESSPLGIIVVDFDDKIMDINQAAFRSLDILPGDFTGSGLTELNSPMAGKLLQLEFGDKKTLDRADGQKFLCRKLFFMDHGFKHPFYIIEEFSEEIRQAEKAAYGKLIRMMAHEVNNTVGAVNSILSTILDNEKSFVTDDQEEVIQMLGVAVQRNYRLNRFMQNFSDVVKLPMPEKDEYDLNLSLKNVILSLTPVLDERNIQIETEFQEPSPKLLADQSQMEQVFLNIIKNSIEAVGPSGHIRVITKTDPLTISISDDGQGLSAESRDRLFSPFFSTKTDGQGIGLTLVREILVNHGFQYRLANREEGGAEFEIRGQ